MTTPSVRATSFYQGVTSQATHVLTLPPGIQAGDTLAFFVAGANTLGTAPVALSIARSATTALLPTALSSSRRSAGSNLIGYVLDATANMSGQAATFTKSPAAGNFKVVMVAAVLRDVSSTIVGQSSAFASVAAAKTTPTLTVAATTQMELSIVTDDDTTSPGTTTWTPPTGVTKLVQAAHAVAGGGAPWTSVALGVANSLSYGGNVGSRTWTANQSNGGCVMTLSLAAPVTPGRFLRDPNGWNLIQQVGTGA